MPSLDPTPFLELAPAPQAVFDHLEDRRGTARFMVRDGTAGEDGAARDWRPVLWEDYASSIARVAVWLATHGLGREDRAAILAPNRVAWMEAALGIQAAGGAMVPTSDGRLRAPSPQPTWAARPHFTEFSRLLEKDCQAHR